MCYLGLGWLGIISAYVTHRLHGFGIIKPLLYGALAYTVGATLEFLSLPIVIAGVIGTHKFSYDLWGDTVNTASRMESHGLSGEIHVSSETYHHLKDVYRFKERGRIHIKGKGEMETYLLLDSR